MSTREHGAPGTERTTTMSISRKNLRNGLAGLTLAATLGGGVFMANAAGAQTSGTSTGAATVTVAAESRPDPFADVLKKLVDAGTITQAQADAVTTALKDARPPMGERGPRGPKGNPQVVADALGVTLDDLKAAHDAGKTVATLAQEKGVAVDTVITAIVDAEKTAIAAKVTAGELPQAKADEILANLQQRVTDMVNGVKPAGAPDGGMRGGHGPRGPRGGQAPADGATATSGTN
jgi:hypothetical protein